MKGKPNLIPLPKPKAGELNDMLAAAGIRPAPQAEALGSALMLNFLTDMSVLKQQVITIQGYLEQREPLFRMMGEWMTKSDACAQSFLALLHEFDERLHALDGKRQFEPGEVPANDAAA